MGDGTNSFPNEERCRGIYTCKSLGDGTNNEIKFCFIKDKNH